jgi:hypothetical protein
VQLGLVSLSDLLLCPVGTLALGNYRDYFSFHSPYSEHLAKGDGGKCEENSTWSVVVSRVGRECCDDTNGLQQGEGKSDALSSWALGLVGCMQRGLRCVGTAGVN